MRESRIINAEYKVDYNNLYCQFILFNNTAIYKHATPMKKELFGPNCLILEEKGHFTVLKTNDNVKYTCIKQFMY